MLQTTLDARSFVIKPNGPLNASNAAEFQGQLLTAVAGESNTSVLVDLEQVESLDSAGLMALVRGLKQAQELERQFRLCSVSPQLRIIFELTQLNEVFEIYENQAAA